MTVCTCGLRKKIEDRIKELEKLEDSYCFDCGINPEHEIGNELKDLLK